MIPEVFTTDDVEDDLARAIQREKDALENLQWATANVSTVRIMHIAGNALHALFMAGDEPKWKHPCQRESLMELSDALKALHRQMFGAD